MCVSSVPNSICDLKTLSSIGEHRSSKAVAADTTVAWETLMSPAMEKRTHKH